MMKAQATSTSPTMCRPEIGRRRFLLQCLFSAAGLALPPLFANTALAAGRFSQTGCTSPRIALIIDDIGASRNRAETFLQLDTPLTFSILPRLKHSSLLTETIHTAGHEIMLHQPMEPFDHGIDPGPGALYVGDPREQITRVFRDNIDQNPYAVGVNNHMGSRFTSCAREIADALNVVKQTHLFFIDSLTAGSSRAYTVAKNLGLTAGCRNVFLDNTPEEEAVLCQLTRLERHARRFGAAIGIGHPFPQTAAGIRRFLRRPAPDPVSLVCVSDLLCREDRES